MVIQDVEIPSRLLRRLDSNRNETIGLEERKRPEQDAVHDRKHRGRDTDTQPEREDRYQREPRVSQERPGTETEILHEAIQPYSTPHVPGGLLHSAHSAELS
jgi:hypothetical protein